ncbi:MAG TPA: histidine--tRNA ligase [Thermoplasmataceae archaeon]|nr:histidine--tRNA ligase [Thermoplasmataceae archaeon]
MKIEKIKGFRDQFPEDMGPRKRLLGVAERQAEIFGFLKVDVPSLESLDLYRIKSGEELVSQTYSFVDKGGREVTMIPEFTPSVVRMLTSRKDISRPVRWYGTPKLWRYEEPQAGRLREHIQFNADIFGPDTAEADAEVIGLAASILDSLELNGEYEIRISNREITEKLLKSLGITDIQAAFAVIDRFRKTDEESFVSGIMETGASREQAQKLHEMISKPFGVGELKKKITGSIPEEDIGQDIMERMMYTGKLIGTYTESSVKYDFSIVRGLSYYTCIVFEAFDIMGEFRSILGGGRYNNLAALLSDQDIPAVGFGMGDVVIELLMKRAGKWHPESYGDSYYVASLLRGDKAYAFETANSIRRFRKAVVEVSERGLSSQMKAAASTGCTYALIIGDKEAKSGTVTVRDLTTGEQKTLYREEFLDSLEKESPQ